MGKLRILLLSLSVAIAGNAWAQRGGGGFHGGGGGGFHGGGGGGFHGGIGGGGFHGAGGGFRGGYGGGFRGGFGGYRGGYGGWGHVWGRGWGRGWGWGSGWGWGAGLGYGLSLGWWPWGYWPSWYDSYYPYYPGYSYYPDYSSDPCGPYGPYNCRIGPSANAYPIGADPASTAPALTPAASNPYFADGQWHRFGAAVGPTYAAGPQDSGQVGLTSAQTGVSYVGDGRWHHFGAQASPAARVASVQSRPAAGNPPSPNQSRASGDTARSRYATTGGARPTPTQPPASSALRLVAVGAQ